MFQTYSVLGGLAVVLTPVMSHPPPRVTALSNALARNPMLERDGPPSSFVNCSITTELAYTTYNTVPGIDTTVTKTNGAGSAYETPWIVTATTETETFSQSIFCTCNGGFTFPTTTVQNQAGANEVYCQTHGATVTYSGAAAATASAVADFGSANNPDWINVPCNYGSLTDSSNNATQQWDDAGATAAWNALVQGWNTANSVDKNNGFTKYVQNFFHLPDGSLENCTDPANTYCLGQFSCGNDQTGSEGVSAPAGYIIGMSIVRLHNFFSDYYSQLSFLPGSVGDQVGAFSTAFTIADAQIEAQLLYQAAEKRTNTILSIGLDLGLSALFSWLIPIAKPLFGSIAEFGTIFANTVVVATVGNVINLEEQGYETEDPADVTDAMGQYSHNLILQWQGAINKTTAQLFSDPSMIGQLIANGAFFGAQQGTPTITQAQQAEAMVYANMLPIAWSGGPAIGMPFVLMNQNSNPQGCAANGDPSKFLTPLPTNRSAAGQVVTYDWTFTDNAASGCFEAGGVNYWLLSISASGKGNDDVDALKVNFDLPTGLKTLTANGTSSQYGGMDFNYVTQSIVNGFAANSYSDNYTTLSSPTSLVNQITSGSHNVTGALPIPICIATDVKSVLLNDFGNHNNSPFWPCPESPSED